MSNELTSYRVNSETLAIVPATITLAYSIYKFKATTTDYTLNDMGNVCLNHKVTAVCEITEQVVELERKSGGFFFKGTNDKVSVSV